MMKRILSPLLLAALTLVLAACQSTDNGQALVAPPDSPVIFSLGAERVTAADFQRRLESDIGPAVADLLAQGQTREQIEQLAAEANIRTQIFDQMVQDALLSRFARQNGIGVDPARIDSEVLAAVAPADDSPFMITVDERVRSARNQLSFEVIARNTTAPMSRMRTILVADEAAADQLLADLAAGADFAALARERSLDTGSGAEGGDLGWVTSGQLPPELEQAATGAPLDTPTRAVTPQGVFVFEVLERDESRPFESFEALTANANAQQYYEATFLPWYEELRREAENSGDLQLAENFDPNSAPLPFPPGTP